MPNLPITIHIELTVEQQRALFDALTQERAAVARLWAVLADIRLYCDNTRLTSVMTQRHLGWIRRRLDDAGAPPDPPEAAP